MNSDLSDLAGDVDFRALVESLDLAIVALDPEWKVLYYNHQARSYFDVENPIGRSFWESLKPDFSETFESSYKNALLGYRNQLDISESSRDTQYVDENVFSGLPLDLLEQKPVKFKFYCEDTHESYSARFNFQNGNFLFRIETITERVEAHRNAEENRQELQKALENMQEARNANPLTGLPGNIRIEQEIKSRMEDNDDFALVYADLDHFKPFNDRYGFDRGDEAIILLRDLLRTALTQVGSADNFLGHVGGDDFVVVLEIPKKEQFCETVIELFDSRVKALYDPEDREKGSIATTNREGEDETFNMMSLTLAVVTSEDKDFENYLEMTETAADVKSFAKGNRRESNYVINRRREDNDEELPE